MFVNNVTVYRQTLSTSLLLLLCGECPRKFWLIPGRHQMLTYNA